MQSDLMQELGKADQLPSPPSVALRILELNRNDQIDIAELTDALSYDPALVAKLLRTANSSLFGYSREISSIHQAVLILGLRSVNLVELSFSILSTWTCDAAGLRLRRVLDEDRSRCLGHAHSRRAQAA